MSYAYERDGQHIVWFVLVPRLDLTVFPLSRCSLAFLA